MSETQPPKIILSTQGTPFASEATAKGFLKKKELDPEELKPVAYMGGWAIMNAVAILQHESSKPKAGVPAKVRFWVVLFQAKSDEKDQDDVTLTLNGVTLQAMREKEVIMPDTYLEVADHCVHNRYTQVPGQDRKVTARIKTFPYERKRESTEAEFRQQVTEGNRIRDQYLERGTRSTSDSSKGK